MNDRSDSSSIRRPSAAAERVNSWPRWMRSVATAPLRQQRMAPPTNAPSERQFGPQPRQGQ